MEQISPSQNDIWYLRIQLISQFILSVFVLTGVGVIVLTPGTTVEADSGAAAIATLIITYWFGRFK